MTDEAKRVAVAFASILICSAAIYFIGDFLPGNMRAPATIGLYIIAVVLVGGIISLVASKRGKKWKL